MKQYRRRHTVRNSLLSLAIVGLLAGYSYWALSQPLPTVSPQAASRTLTVQTPASSLQWPLSGQAAIAILGTKTLETHNLQAPAPTASTAKLITALVVLQQKPLQTGQPGPTITLTAKDVALYQTYAKADGSVTRVQAGEQISEYQMLQAMMLPSANNIADSLAVWAFGSLDNYTTTANAYLASLGLKDSHVGKDASGLDPSTTSTAHDLVKLGLLAMQDPVLSEIVAQKTAANIPVAGTIKNVNFLLGTANIIGIKTGNSDQAGGVYVSAARTTVDEQPVTIVTAVMGAPTLFDAVQGSLPFIVSAQNNFQPVTVVKTGDVVGHYRTAWGASVSAVARNDLKLHAWAGGNVSATIKLQPQSSLSAAGKTAGQILAGQNSVGVKLQGTIPEPPIWWRLLHPLAK